MIKNEEISVVVTGKILHETSDAGFKTSDVLKSIRSSLPKSNIILSTWESERVDDLDYDILIQNIDPGPLFQKDKRQFTSQNRQIVSSVSGLTSAKTLFSIRMRTDTLLLSDSFKKYWGKFKAFNRHYKIFKDYILTSQIGSSNPRTSAEIFHPSDLFHFGYTSDLLTFWNCDLISLYGESSIDTYFENACLAPEQYFWKNCISRKLKMNIDPQKFNIKNIILSEMFFINNFITVPSQELGIELPKRLCRLATNNYFSYEEWKNLYRTYNSKLAFMQKIELSITAGFIKRLKVFLRPLKHKIFNYEG